MNMTMESEHLSYQERQTRSVKNGGVKLFAVVLSSKRQQTQNVEKSIKS